jgi:hypothetical protein
MIQTIRKVTILHQMLLHVTETSVTRAIHYDSILKWYIEVTTNIIQI